MKFSANVTSLSTLTLNICVFCYHAHYKSYQYTLYILTLIKSYHRELRYLEFAHIIIGKS